MRIQQLRFKNLSSLHGEWVIDLTHPEFVADGIFAITGPTGAGKSTILDAICLALYGRTPRLSRITKRDNALMSRQTGECFAEVVFETQKGCYRCHWSQRRARKKPDNDLQAPKHEIADASTGAILETKILEVAACVEKLTGMDFDRFTRSMLLAQGGFAAFLQADSNERAPILEQITGTEVYSRISIKVHERARAEREKLNLLKTEISGITVFSNEQIEQMRGELIAAQHHETELTAKMLEAGKALAWLKNVDELRNEIKLLDDEEKKLKVEREAFEPKRKHLLRADAAAGLEGGYATLGAVRKQQDEDQRVLASEISRLPDVESSVRQLESALRAAEESVEKSRCAQKSAAPLIQKVRTIDYQLSEMQRAIKTDAAYCRKMADQIESDRKQLTQQRKQLETTRQELACIYDDLQKNSQDGQLVGELAGIEARIHQLIAAEQDIASKTAAQTKIKKQLESEAKKLAECADNSAVRKQELETVRKQIDCQREVLGKLLNSRHLREYRAEKDALLREMVLMQKIADLESERMQLEEGKPCPLCGSLQHPFAHDHQPPVNESEQKIAALAGLIEKAEQLEAEIQTLETAGQVAQKGLAVAEKNEADTANAIRIVEKSLQDITVLLAQNHAQCAELRQSVLTKLEPFGVPAAVVLDMPQIFERLKKQMRKWQDNMEKKSVLDKQITELEANLKSGTAVLETREKVLLEKRAELSKLEKNFESLNLERRQLFGVGHPDDEEIRLEKVSTAAESVEKKARQSWENAKKQLHAITVRIAALKSRLDNRNNELEALETTFLAALRAAGFADEQQFVASRLTVEDFRKLKAEERALDDRQGDMQTRKKDRERRLSVESEKRLTVLTRETLETEIGALEALLTQQREAIAELKLRLAQNQQAMERIGVKQAAVNAQKKECDRWEQLHALIGSADGKKYRNFAQGLTFEWMIRHANRQLQKLTDRYLLIHDLEQPLELNVIDNYQAGEIRTTKNLSGGESFIISLALALGLSKMASNNVRVDSLFLDEGFGSLDEEALEIALDTLAGLRQDGKLIAVISHVPLLKERIGVQIQVIPLAGGRSRLAGPGCRRIEQS
ncbi:exonuclease SbcC [Nitrosomonas marina]|uniref:Exonuclease SbcC n=1 Tax=Nitrosomonas marina TaxID=917 RepID=A0A1I0FQ40_9PROT|nr:AAA family ATPase [Nitrosomonas marina]SET60304.1 exonuclease SbcC [Nitrosomonas marina]